MVTKQGIKLIDCEGWSYKFQIEREMATSLMKHVCVWMAWHFKCIIKGTLKVKSLGQTLNTWSTGLKRRKVHEIKLVPSRHSKVVCSTTCVHCSHTRFNPHTSSFWWLYTYSNMESTGQRDGREGGLMYCMHYILSHVFASHLDAVQLHARFRCECI